jgi:phage host-nuclease inhibitor protein Gam
MKFTVDIDIDWLGEDGSLDDEIRGQIIASVKQTVAKRAIEKLEAEAEGRVGDILDEAVNKLTAQWLDKPIEITDRWGDVKEQGSIMELLKERFDAFWKQDVDNRTGKTHSGYGDHMPRSQWIMTQVVQKKCEAFADGLIKDVDAHVKKLVSSRLKDVMGEKIVNDLGVESILERLQQPKG